MRHKRLSLGATLGAIGVVYGDIGTSPLYALEQSLNATGSAAHSPAALMGVLSLMFWSLLAIVTVKYVMLIMRADNAGEGGILSLFALVQRWLEEAERFSAKYRNDPGPGSHSHVAQGLGSVMNRVHDFDRPEEFL